MGLNLDTKTKVVKKEQLKRLHFLRPFSTAKSSVYTLSIYVTPKLVPTWAAPKRNLWVPAPRPPCPVYFHRPPPRALLSRPYLCGSCPCISARPACRSKLRNYCQLFGAPPVFNAMTAAIKHLNCQQYCCGMPFRDLSPAWAWVEEYRPLNLNDYKRPFTPFCL